jgi:hypothetical protein
MAFRPAARHQTDDQAVLGVQGDVVPAIALVIVVGVAAVAVLLLLADERRVFVVGRARKV